MTAVYDVIVIGSGPAGVSASWPLVESGKKVLMLDQGNDRERLIGHRKPFMDIRRSDPEQWRLFLGEDLYGVKNAGDVSPKLKVPESAYVFDGFSDAYQLATKNFTAVGSLAKGGLSNAWGAGAYAYDDRDLDAFPISRDELTESYQAIAARIGISGVADDDMGAFYGGDLPLQPPIGLHENAAHLLRMYQAKRMAVNKDGVSLGRARNAVLSKALGRRGACAEDDMCLWGCDKGAIYSAADEVTTLCERDGFTYWNNAFVQGIERDGSRYAVRYGPSDAAGSGTEVAHAKIVILAAGTLGSTKLAIDFLGLHDQPIHLSSNPAFALALCLPRRLGASVADKGFSLGQLGFIVEDGGGSYEDYGHGALFAGGSLLTGDVARYLPLTRPGAISFMRRLMPSLVFLNCFLSDSFARHTIMLTKSGRLAIEGAYSADFMMKVESLRRRLSRAFRRLGAYALPGGVRVSEPGSDIHYAGTLPMRAKTSDLSAATLATDRWCEIAGAKNLFVVDGAVFPRLTAKNPTFTIMANADRVGRYISTNYLG